MSVSRFSDRYWPIHVFATSVQDACRKLDEYANGCPIEHPIDGKVVGTAPAQTGPPPGPHLSERCKHDGP